MINILKTFALSGKNKTLTHYQKTSDRVVRDKKST